MQECVPQIIEIFRVLDKHQVKFIIVGGVCAVLHGAPITTFDLDLVHSRTPVNLQFLMNALMDLDASYRGHPKQIKPDIESLASPGHHLLITRFGPLDLLETIEKDLGYADLIGHSEEIQIENLAFRILSLEYLIEIKEETFREKDRLILTILKYTLKEREKTKKA
jgi:predicted nucleotidyltransferase